VAVLGVIMSAFRGGSRRRIEADIMLSSRFGALWLVLLLWGTGVCDSRG